MDCDKCHKLRWANGGAVVDLGVLASGLGAVEIECVADRFSGLVSAVVGFVLVDSGLVFQWFRAGFRILAILCLTPSISADTIMGVRCPLPL